MRLGPAHASSRTTRSTDVSDVPEGARPTLLADLPPIAVALAGSRDIAKQLTLRDIRTRYEQAAFGFASRGRC